MNPEWRKIVASLALVIVLLGIVVPDACADDAFNVAPPSTTVSIPHTGDQPFGCQHQEDCFCCAHLVPLSIFEFCPFASVTRAEQQQFLSGAEEVPPAPYRPPRA